MGKRNDEIVREPNDMPLRYPPKNERAIKYDDPGLIISGATQRNYYEEGFHLPTDEPGYLAEHTERLERK